MMPNNNISPSKRASAKGSVANAARPIWLFAALSTCLVLATTIIAIVFVMLPAERQIQATDTRVEHTHQVITAIGNLLASAEDAETGQRGFLLTEDAKFLEPYDRGIKILWSRFSSVQELTFDNPGQQSRLQVLRDLLLSRLAILARTIELARGGHLKTAVDQVRGGQGKALMDAVRESCADMIATEERLLLIRRLDQGAARRSDWIALALMSFGAGSGILISGSMTVAAGVSARRQFAATAAERLRLLNILDFAPIMVRDIGGAVRFWSEGCGCLYGWTAEQAIGRLSFELLQTVYSVPYDEIEAELLQTGEWSGDLYQRTQSGAEVIVSAHKVLQRDADGSLPYVKETVADVTALRRTETALHASEARLRLVQEISGTAYSDQTLPEQEALVSSAFTHIYGLPPTQTRVLITEIIAQVHPDDRERVAQLMPENLTTDRKVTAEYRICRPDGEVRWISMRGEVLLGADGQPKRIISAQQDITEIVTAREALALRHEELKDLSRHLAKARDLAEQANRAKSRFLAGMSHELRTPLNGILGYAHLLHMEGGLSAGQSTRVDAMLEAGKHLLQMITCVLDLSEIEAEHVELRPVEFDVEVVASACLDLVRPAAELKRLALSILVAPGTRRELIADPTRLRQVLFNLLGNAVKFTSHGGVELCLRSSADGSALRIEVVDTGPGIPAELHQRLFQDFERLDTADGSTVEGAGLGLALSARLATLMGGRLGQDDNPNGGSIFWLELPLNTIDGALPAVAPASDPGDTEPASESPRVLHVLVVDDVLMNRDIASSFLRVAGHEVTCADSGEAAVAAASITDFAVILMDIRMPGMDGLEATRRIRALEGARGRVPIIALTAHAFTEQVAECRLAGMDDHLSKPFDPDGLLAAVTRAVAMRQTHKEPVSTPTTVPASPAIPVIGAELLVFDAKAFRRTTDFLAPEAVASHLQSIAESVEALRCSLGKPDALNLSSAELGEAVHALAGSAGLLGFERLASIGRRFDQAVQSGAPETITLAEALSTTIEATLLTIHDHTATAVEV